MVTYRNCKLYDILYNLVAIKMHFYQELYFHQTCCSPSRSYQPSDRYLAWTWYSRKANLRLHVAPNSWIQVPFFLPCHHLYYQLFYRQRTLAGIPLVKDL